MRGRLRSGWMGDGANLSLAFAAVLALGLGARVLGLALLEPQSDVYYYDKEAVAVLLHGTSPYGHAYLGVPATLATPGAENVFAYLPLTVLYLVPFYLLGDVRLGALVADAVIALCLYALLGRWGLLASALYLLAPFTILLSTVYLNNVVFAMAFVALATLLERSERGLLSGVAFGLALATSLLAWLLVPFYAYQHLSRHRARVLAAALAVAIVVILPFVAAAPGDFAYDVLSFQFQRPVAPPLALGGPFGISLNPTLESFAVYLSGWSVPSFARVALDAIVLVVLLSWGRASSWEVPACLFVGVSVLVLPSNFYFAYAELPYLLSLTWLARRGQLAPGPWVKAS